jgi:Na+-transporting methylmalonyl-CoA/oxaloacetate decarboxylase beta subunit
MMFNFAINLGAVLMFVFVLDFNPWQAATLGAIGGATAVWIGRDRDGK